MRTSLLCLHLLLVAPASAQIINGSFEENGQGSIAGWQFNFASDTALLLPGGAPGCGDWHVGYPMQFPVTFHPLFQPLPWPVSEVDSITIGFWSRAQIQLHFDVIQGFEIRFGHMMNGMYAWNNNSGSSFPPDTVWTYHVVSLGDHGYPGDAITAVCFAGYDTASTSLLELDGIEILSVVMSPMNIATVDPARILGYYDPADDAVVINRASSDPLRIIDAAGRIALTPSVTGASAAQRISVTGLAPGIYTAVAGNRYVRFFKR